MQSRRAFLKQCGTVLAGAGLSMRNAGAKPARRPNIIYILADDLGYGDLSCYGQEKFTTPHIDSLARDGIKFTQHYSGSTVCAPSRSCLMTGQHTGHTPIRGNRVHEDVGDAPLPPETVTVAEQLRGAGYRTGAFGKWGLGYPGSKGAPLQQGFDTFFGYNCQRNAHTYYPTWLYHDGKRVELDGETYAHDLIMQHALDFIRESSGVPFFCYMPVTIPHAAMHVPESYAAPYRERFSEFEDVIGKYAGPDVRNPVAAFAGMMQKLDEGVGQVLDLLDELSLAEDTLVIFTSDNGPHHEGGHKPAFFNSNGGLRGLKRDLYEGGIRVPMLARWRGRIPAGATTDHASAFWDFMPTACELADVTPPEKIDGISYLPALLQEGTQKQHEYLYWEFYEQGGKRAARWGAWKAVQRDVLTDKPSPIELYNLAEDRDESEDLAAAHPALVEEARRIFEQAHTPNEHYSLPPRI